MIITTMPAKCGKKKKKKAEKKEETAAPATA